MTDPRCPYCGRVMELAEYDIGYWYYCDKDMSSSPMRDTPEEALAAANQRCTPPAQPLTLTELLALERPWPLWVERVGYKLSPMILYATYCVSSDKIVTMNSLVFDTVDYNRSWRCWRTRPTDAEREAAPWEVTET